MSKAIGQRAWFVAMACTIMAILAYVYLSGGSVRQESVVSPDHRYRVEFHTASRLQWLTHIQQLEEPGFAVVVRASDDRASPSSRVLTLVDSPVIWLPDGVMIGTQAKYVFRTGRWE
jgi:hypothetical protein